MKINLQQIFYLIEYSGLQSHCFFDLSLQKNWFQLEGFNKVISQIEMN